MRLETLIEKRGIPLSGPMVEKLNRFSRWVWEKGVVRGLSGRKSLEEIFEKDILDSLLLTQILNTPPSCLLDIGSGAGFPGIPLKVFYPTADLSLVESKKKAADFLREVSAMLGLSGVTVVWDRVEKQAALNGWKDGFDWVTGRAVAPLQTFFIMAAPFVRRGGFLLLQKGNRWQAELEAAREKIEKAGFALFGIYPGLCGEQKIIVLHKP